MPGQGVATPDANSNACAMSTAPAPSRIHRYRGGAASECEMREGNASHEATITALRQRHSKATLLPCEVERDEQRSETQSHKSGYGESLVLSPIRRWNQLRIKDLLSR